MGGAEGPIGAPIQNHLDWALKVQTSEPTSIRAISLG